MVLKKQKKTFQRIVVKFGGSSLADGLSISRAVKSVIKKARQGVQLVVVVSAMGKTTDTLIDIANKACNSSISNEDLDDIMAMGERTSARIFSAALKSLKTRSCYFDPENPNWPIITDKTFKNAKPILPLCEKMIKTHIEPLLEKDVVVVVPGFIGKTDGGAITTIGRGGSDITALILAQALSADQVIIVTDVPGIMTADPKIIKNPEKIAEIPVDALVGLADSGTKFIHKKALKYKHPKIDIKIISNMFGDLDSEGTIILEDFPKNMIIEQYPNSATAVTIVGKELSKSPQIFYEILNVVNKVDTEFLGMSVNHNSIIIYLASADVENILETLHAIVVKTENAIAMAVRKNLALIRIKGIELEETPGVISSITKTLNMKEINIYGIFTITSSVVVFVDMKDKEKTVSLIEETIGNNNTYSQVYGR
ncbi:aspartate kinase [Candidatus Bathyarchaeota archaeon]|nr:aspartate kinase [Candidatus Bathyarchaeota archaeon]